MELIGFWLWARTAEGCDFFRFFRRGRALEAGSKCRYLSWRDRARRSCLANGCRGFAFLFFRWSGDCPACFVQQSPNTTVSRVCVGALHYQPHLQQRSAYRLGRDLWLTCRQAWLQHAVQESCDVGTSGRPWRCSRQVETVASSRVRGRVVAETLSKTTSCFTWWERVASFWSGPFWDRAGRDFGQVDLQVASAKGCCWSFWILFAAVACFAGIRNLNPKQLWMNKVGER